MNKKTKVFIRFLIVIVIAGLFGAYIGYNLVGLSMDDLRKVISESVMPVLYYFTLILIICSSALVFTQIPSYLKCKRDVDRYSDDSEYEEYERIDQKLSKTLSIAELGFILSFIGMVGYLSFIPTNEHGSAKVLTLISLVMFCGAIFTYLILQNNLVNLTKKMNPKMQGDVLDFKFQKEWYSTMDEAEKLIVGYASYKAFQTSSTATVVALVLTMILSVVFEFGPIPAFIIGGLWVIQKVSYLHAASMKEKGNE